MNRSLKVLIIGNGRAVNMLCMEDGRISQVERFLYAPGQMLVQQWKTQSGKRQYRCDRTWPRSGHLPKKKSHWSNHLLALKAPLVIGCCRRRLRRRVGIFGPNRCRSHNWKALKASTKTFLARQQHSKQRHYGQLHWSRPCCGLYLNSQVVRANRCIKLNGLGLLGKRRYFGANRSWAIESRWRHGCQGNSFAMQVACGIEEFLNRLRSQLYLHGRWRNGSTNGTSQGIIKRRNKWPI